VKFLRESLFIVGWLIACAIILWGGMFICLIRGAIDFVHLLKAPVMVDDIIISWAVLRLIAGVYVTHLGVLMVLAFLEYEVCDG